MSGIRRRRTFGGLLVAVVLMVGAAPGVSASAVGASDAARSPSAVSAAAGSIPSVGTDWGAPGPYDVSVDIGIVHTFYR